MFVIWKKGLAFTALALALLFFPLSSPVRAQDEELTQGCGGYVYPGRPTTTSPTNDTTPTFTWTPVSGNPDYYQFFWSQTPGGEDSVSENLPGDATSFTIPTPLTEGTWYVMVYGHVECGWDSANGEVKILNYEPQQLGWTETTGSADWGGRLYAASTTFNNKIWIMGGSDNGTYKNDVWSSSDGVTWTQVKEYNNQGWSPRYGHTVTVFDGKMWVIGGNELLSCGTNEEGEVCSDQSVNDTWYSTDGLNWTRAIDNADWADRWGHQVIAHDNKLWVIGGQSINNGSSLFNDVWYSSDGVTWTEATAHANWSARYFHSSVVFGGKMWVLGGQGSDEVWSSTDGANWSMETDAPGWDARGWHKTLVANGKLWLLGGYAGVQDEITGYERRDVWWSDDGVTWQQAIDAPWPARDSFGATVFNNRLWVMSGESTLTTYANDVWKSDCLANCDNGGSPGSDNSNNSNGGSSEENIGQNTGSTTLSEVATNEDTDQNEKKKAEEISLDDFQDFLNGIGKTLNLEVGQIISYTLPDSGEEHSITIKEIGPDYVVVTFASTPTDVRIAIDQTVKQDVNSDGQPDIEVTLNYIGASGANLTFKQIAGTTAIAQPASDTPQKKSRKTMWTYISLAALLMAMGLIAKGVRRTRHTFDK